MYTLITVQLNKLYTGNGVQDAVSIPYEDANQHKSEEEVGSNQDSECKHNYLPPS